MAPQRRDNSEDVQESSQILADPIVFVPTGGPLAGISITMAASTIAYIPDVPIVPAVPDVKNYDPSKTKYGKGYPPYNYSPYSPSPEWRTVASDSSSWWETSSTSSASITPTSAVRLSEIQSITQSTTSCPPVGTGDASSFNTAYPYENEPPWSSHKGKPTSGGMYAAAAVTPIIVLAIIGGIAYFCMRKRKRQREEMAAAERKAEELKMQSRSLPMTQAYMAPNPPLQYPDQNAQFLAPPIASVQPVNLGPISSGGAYFTGIDTSDVVSITSSNNIRSALPISSADNDSLAEPPPPYRPRSVAPPSFTDSSRHSSLRVSTAPPATSQTLLIGRSPFDDPIDDDAISDLSGPAIGRAEDAMSVVSDLSYQNDPVVNRSSL